MKFKFASAAPSEPTVFGAQRPGYDYHSVGQEMIDEWTDFMLANGIRRVCCLLPQEQLAFYGTDLLVSYRKSFGNHHVCHAEVQDLHLIDLADLEQTILPFLRQSDRITLPVVVHCSGGSGRTGHVLAAWLVRERLLPLAEAIAHLRNTERNPYEAVLTGNATEQQLVNLITGQSGKAGA
jgi:protein-tyrosine phosphatase